MNATATMPPRPTLVSYDSGDGENYEIVDGLRVEIPPMSAESTRIASRLSYYLNMFSLAQGFGESIAEGLFHLPLRLDRNRRPDVAFVPSSRWPQTKKAPSSNAWDVLPDLVAEVISPNDLVAEVLDKIEEYFLAGVRLVWVVHPKQQLVYVYESPTQIRVLTRNDSLDGQAILPGFQLLLVQLFPTDT